MAAVVLPKTTFAITPAPTAVTNAPQRILFIGQQVLDTSATGTLISEVQPGDEDNLFGTKSMLATMIREFRRINNVSSIDAIPLNDKSGEAKASGSIIFTGTATEANILTITVLSEQLYQFSVSASLGDTDDDIGSALADAINANTTILATASNVSGTVTVTSSFAGLEGNNGSIRVEGAVAGISANIVKMSGSGTNPDLPDLDALLGDVRYQTVVWPASYTKSTITDFLDPRFNPTNKIVDGVAISAETDTSLNLKAAVSPLNSESYTLLGNKIIPDVAGGPVATPIDSVVDDGSGFAEFNFATGPTLSLGNDVTIQNFNANPSYNGDYVFADVSTTTFQPAVKFLTNETIGAFSFETSINSVTDNSNKAQFDFVTTTIANGETVVISDFVTNTNYNGTFSVNDFSAGQFDAGVLFVADEATTGSFTFDPIAVTSVTNNGGIAQFDVASTNGLANGDLVTTTNFLTITSYNQTAVAATNVLGASFELGTVPFDTSSDTGDFIYDTVIDSIVADGDNNAQFNFTGGPTLIDDTSIIISNFITNTTYNGTFTIADQAAGQFTARVAFGSDEFTGKFEFDTPITSVTIDASNASIFNYSGSNVLGIGQNVTLKDFVTNTSYNGSFAAYNPASNVFSAKADFVGNETTGSFTIFGTANVSEVGGSLFEFNPTIASQFAGVRTLRLTQNQNIAQFLVGGSITNAFGGPSRAATPYHNTPFDRLNVIKNNLGWSQFEQDDLNNNGVSFLGNNSANNTIIAGDIVTTYVTNAQGSPDITFKFLNYVDTASNIREYFWNNNRAQYAQTVLTDGDLVPGIRMANEQAIATFQSSLYSELSNVDPNGVLYGLTQAGDDAQSFFDENLTVSITLSTGTVVISAQVPIVTQLRVINGTLQVIFDINTRG